MIAPSLEFAGEEGDLEATQCRIFISGRVSRVAGQLWIRIFHVRPHSIGETRFLFI